MIIFCFYRNHFSSVEYYNLDYIQSPLTTIFSPSEKTRTPSNYYTYILYTRRAQYIKYDMTRTVVPPLYRHSR